MVNDRATGDGKQRVASLTIPRTMIPNAAFN
jgi:hypothetical protein